VSYGNHILFVKNLPYSVTAEELYELFGKFGAIRQIRAGTDSNTKGSAFVVYEDARDAKVAQDKLSGYNFQNRYLIVLFHSAEKMAKASAADLATRRAELDKLKEEHKID
jgi:pre-mRNA branch site protein p14